MPKNPVFFKLFDVDTHEPTYTRSWIVEQINQYSRFLEWERETKKNERRSELEIRIMYYIDSGPFFRSFSAPPFPLCVNHRIGMVRTGTKGIGW